MEEVEEVVLNENNPRWREPVERSADDVRGNSHRETNRRGMGTSALDNPLFVRPVTAFEVA